MLRITSIIVLLAAFGFAIWAGSADDPLRQQWLGGWFALLLGVGLVLRGGVRMQDGEVRLRSRTVRRAENPGLYRAGLAFLILPGVVLLGAGVYLLVAAGG